LPQAFPQTDEPCAFLSQAAAGEIAGHPKAVDLMGRQRSGPQPSFLPAAEDDRLQARPRLVAHIERADTLGAIELVCRDGHEVDRQRMYVEGYLAGRLRGVTVEEHAARTAEGADRGDILDH